MFKFRALIFFLFAMTVLFSAVLEYNKVRTNITVSTTFDSENTNLEIKHCLFQFPTYNLDSGHILIKKIKRVEIVFINNVYNLTLFQLLKSYRIALPPPQIT